MGTGTSVCLRGSEETFSDNDLKTALHLFIYKIMPKELDYYRLYLQKFLQDTENDLMNDEDFISSRADLAAQEFEDVRRDGASVAVAQESAMAVLINGL